MKPRYSVRFPLRVASSFVALAVLLALVAFAGAPGRVNKVALSMESNTVEKGKKITARGDLYFEAGDGSLITHFTYPFDHVLVSNRFGEVKMYDPKANAVAIRQDQAFSTKGTMLYFFLASNSSDLGLREMGFSLTHTEYKDQYMVSTWNTPPAMAEALSTVELVHEGYRPVYMAYFDAKGKLLRKVYFSKYQTLLDIELPVRITEINYFNEGADSAVSRIDYSNIRLNEEANDPYFDFEIPEDAKVVE